MSPINRNVVQVVQLCIYRPCIYASSEIGTYLVGKQTVLGTRRN